MKASPNRKSSMRTFIIANISWRKNNNNNNKKTNFEDGNYLTNKRKKEVWDLFFALFFSFI